MTELTTQQKADRWDALMSCERIRMMGSAKLGDPEQQHLGLELWAKYPGNLDDSHGRQVLMEFVEAMQGQRRKSYQERVGDFVRECFGPVREDTPRDRLHRFFEEATELVQAGGGTAEDCHRLVDYVFSREKGDMKEEAGDAMFTLAALCRTFCITMEDEGEARLAYAYTRIEQIREKDRTKPMNSPLPGETCPKGGYHEYGIDGQHSNEYCKKCFQDKPA